MNNYLSPQAIEYQTHNIHGVAIQVLAGDRHKNVAGLKPEVRGNCSFC
jgi:hypothetical protein